ncbi:hypothetical protein BDQ17DRAFT_485783 [Cyathus striatus]|nr:hypothetical protein BDQ17DRAFT_485783 [Cyathus striatus]
MNDESPDAELWKEARTYHVIGISAKSHTPFSAVVNSMLECLENNGHDIDLSSLGYTTTARRIDYATRVAFSVSSIDELKLQLRKASSGVTVDIGTAPRVGFAIAGNGSQFKGFSRNFEALRARFAAPRYMFVMDHYSRKVDPVQQLSSRIR